MLSLMPGTEEAFDKWSTLPSPKVLYGLSQDSDRPDHVFPD